MWGDTFASQPKVWCNPLSSSFPNQPALSHPQPHGQVRCVVGSRHRSGPPLRVAPRQGNPSASSLAIVPGCWSWQWDNLGDKTVGGARGQMEGHTDGQTSEVYFFFCSARALAPQGGAES